MLPKQKIRINLIGTGYDLWCGELPERMRGLPAMEIVETIQGQSTIVIKRNNKSKEVVQVENEFKNFIPYRGPNLLEFGQMEIWINKKRIYKYKFHDLADSATLFPIFKIKTEELIPASEDFVISGLEEKGHVAQHSLDTENFSAEQLLLNTIRFNVNGKQVILLHHLTFNGRAMKVKYMDTNVTGVVWEPTSRKGH